MRPLRRGRRARLAGVADALSCALAVTAAGHVAVNARRLRVPPPGAPVRERVSVLLPARDEAARIGPAVRALLASTGLDDLELVVYDDASSDGTGERARAAAAGDHRARVIADTREPPPGWLGKTWACHQLAQAASGTILIFVDADVTVEPDALARTARLLRSAALDLVSPYPRQMAGSPAERLVQPLLQWSWLALLPLRWAERTRRPSGAAANGQLLCVDAATYQRAGGHAAAGVRGHVLEDIALLRAVKAAGGRGGVADGTEIATTRMYDGWAQLRDGYAKSLWAAGGTPAASAAQVGLLAFVFVWPAARAAAGSRLALAATLAGVAGRWLAARRTGARRWPDCAAHPVSIVLFGYLTGLSWARHRTGTARWKGRPVRVGQVPGECATPPATGGTAAPWPG